MVVRVSCAGRESYKNDHKQEVLNTSSHYTLHPHTHTHLTLPHTHISLQSYPPTTAFQSARERPNTFVIWDLPNVNSCAQTPFRIIKCLETLNTSLNPACTIQWKPYQVAELRFVTLIENVRSHWWSCVCDGVSWQGHWCCLWKVVAKAQRSSRSFCLCALAFTSWLQEELSSWLPPIVLTICTEQHSPLTG